MSSFNFELQDPDSGAIWTITVTEEDVDGDGYMDLAFTIEQTSGDAPGDLRGLFFDLSADLNADDLGLTILESESADVTDWDADEASISTLGGGVEVNGEVVKEFDQFDFGVAFVSAGSSDDPIQTTTFVLTSDSTSLSLDLVSEQDFAIRLQDAKFGATAPTVPTVPTDPLFTEGNDGTFDPFAPINMNLIMEGDYLAGTQYNALGGDDFVILPEDEAAAQAAGYDLTQAFDGGDGNDILVGGLTGNTILGGAGNDVIAPTAGSNTIDGGADFDVVIYNTTFELDAVTFTGGTASNTIAVGDWEVVGDGGASTTSITGVEFVVGSLFDDTFNGGDANEIMSGDAGNDVMNGGAGDDDIEGGEGNDVINGGAGNDQALRGGDGADVINGGDGEDHIFGDSGNDTLFGGAGNDLFLEGLNGFASSGDDTIDGGDGDLDAVDYFTGGTTGGLSYVGGTGVDAGTAIVTGDLSIGTDTLINIEWVDGTNYNDIFMGGDADEWLWGQEGDDTIDGGGGNDLLYGQLGNDSIAGGEGDDWIEGGDGNDIALSGNDGADQIYGGDGDDHILGNAGNDEMFGEAGNDLFLEGLGQAASSGNDLIDGGDGFDAVNYFTEGTTGGLTYVGGTGVDAGTAVVTGDLSIGTDTLISIEWVDGTEFNDVFIGGDADEVLWGQGGDDVIGGGGGNDTLIGDTDDFPAGADTFVYSTGDGNDRIDDFSGFGEEGDVINLAGVDNVNDFGDVQNLFFYDGTDTFIVFDDANDQFLGIANTDVASLTAEDFTFTVV